MLKQWRIQWIKKILDEATYKLACKVRFLIAVWSPSKMLRASSFIENVPQISAKPIAFQQNRPFFTNRFSAKLASKISVKFPRNRPFFPRICPWKSREIWLFFPRPTRSPDKETYVHTSMHICARVHIDIRVHMFNTFIWAAHILYEASRYQNNSHKTQINY